MEREQELSVASLEAELRRSRDRLRLVFDNLPEGLALIDENGRILAANHTFCRGIVGRRPQDVVGCDYRLLWALLTAEAELQLEDQSPAENTTPLIPPEDAPFGGAATTWRIMSTDTMGQSRWYSVERVPTDAEFGIGVQYLERWHDITNHEELQRRLLLHDQLNSLGRLAASVAHEVGNPLQSAMGCLELCREDASLSERAREYLSLALGELDRMGRTMDSLRNLYRSPQPNWDQIDLNGLMREVIQLTQRQLERTHIQLELVLDVDLPPIVGQSDGLRQVFLNLVLNAQQAMPQGGVLQVHSRPKATDRLCQITVRDNGMGMSAEQQAHLFEPFRSSKSQGVGLGLYLTRQIIEQHAGHIEIQSQLGVGTQVTVFLPWSEAGPPMGRM